MLAIYLALTIRYQRVVICTKAGSGLPGYYQINKVTIIQSPPNRSGCMLMGKTNNAVHPGYASYLRGTKTAKVESLWLSEDPNACVETPR